MGFSPTRVRNSNIQFGCILVSFLLPFGSQMQLHMIIPFSLRGFEGLGLYCEHYICTYRYVQLFVYIKRPNPPCLLMSPRLFSGICHLHQPLHNLNIQFKWGAGCTSSYSQSIVSHLLLSLMHMCSILPSFLFEALLTMLSASHLVI